MKYAAFFDLDRTLYPGVFAVDFVEALKKNKQVCSILESMNVAENAGVVVVMKSLQASEKLPFVIYQSIAHKVGRAARGRYNTFPLQLFKRLRKQGYCLVAVSQSPFVVLKHYCNAIDGDSFDLVSSPLPTIIENNGIQYLGRHSVVSPDERDKYTAVTLLAKCYGFDLSKSIAIGDSLNDAPMMRAVSGQKIAYNPKDDLRAVAESENWDVIIEVENLNEEEKRE